MGKQTKEPIKVKCADCGFLCVIYQDDFSYTEAKRLYRLQGFYGGSYADDIGREPHCFVQAQDIHLEPLIANGATATLAEGAILRKLENKNGKDVTDSAVLAIINKLRVCQSFYPWRQGFSPKEHYDMLDRERWQRWQEGQRREDKRWRIIELIVIGFITVLIAGGFTVLGALIERGIIP